MENIRNTNKNLLIVIGGHHTSGLVTAQNALNRGWEVVWIGHKYSMAKDKNVSAEYLEVTQSEIPFVELKSAKVFGSGSIWSIFKIVPAILYSLSLLRNLKVQNPGRIIGIISFGGYLAVPVVLAGWLLGISSLTHEQTLVGGGANRLISLLVKKIALTWPKSQKYFPIRKSVVTGLPLRPEIKNLVRKPNQHQIKTIFITGGKQGSHLLNQLVLDNLETLLTKYHLVHQTGLSSLNSDFQTAIEKKSLLPKPLAQKYTVEKYFFPTQIADIFSKTDLIIGRSGAHTTYELAYLGIPSILVPISWSSRGEQLVNAQYLAGLGLAIVLPESKLSSSSLFQSLSQAADLNPAPIPLPANADEILLNLIDDQIFQHEIKT